MNMTYCMMRNTLKDLQDANRRLGRTEDMSVEEQEARLDLIALCVEIAHDFGDEVGAEIEMAEEEEDMDEAAHLP